MDGWIKLHRQIIDSRCFANEGLFKVWMWCLLKANHKTNWIPIKTGRGESEVEVKEGQFIFGRKSAAKKLKMKPETVRSRMNKLKSIGNITMQSTTHYTIVSIVNWDTYQNEHQDNHQPTNQPSTNQTPSNHQPNTTDKNVKNENNDNNEKKYKKAAERIITRLNELGKKKFRFGDTNTKNIIARLKENFTESDCLKVLETKIRDPHFINNPQYYNPETLFRPSKFEKYLNEDPDGYKKDDSMKKTGFTKDYYKPSSTGDTNEFF